MRKVTPVDYQPCLCVASHAHKFSLRCQARLLPSTPLLGSCSTHTDSPLVSDGAEERDSVALDLHHSEIDGSLIVCVGEI